MSVEIPGGYRVVAPSRAREAGMMAGLAALVGLAADRRTSVAPSGPRSGRRVRRHKARRRRAHESRRLNRTRNARRHPKSAKRRK